MKATFLFVLILSLFPSFSFAGNKRVYIPRGTVGTDAISDTVEKLGYVLVDRQTDADLTISTQFVRNSDDSTPCRMVISVSGSQNFEVGASKQFYRQLMFSFIGCKSLVIKKASEKLYQKLQRADSF